MRPAPTRARGASSSGRPPRACESWCATRSVGQPVIEPSGDGVHERHDIVAMARVARDEGADAVTLVNTIPGRLDHRLANGSGGVSGPALLPIGVLATRKVAEQVGMPVIGVGGIGSAACRE